MPIKPENRSRYPKDWRQIRAAILKRARSRCEWCGVENHATIERSGNRTRIVLTIAHLDHTPENCAPENLRALCQRCHLDYDRAHHLENARLTRQTAKDQARPLFQPQAQNDARTQ
jgi:5-methylcytosine-specific restriction endonuclease McrA